MTLMPADAIASAGAWKTPAGRRQEVRSADLMASGYTRRDDAPAAILQNLSAPVVRCEWDMYSHGDAENTAFYQKNCVPRVSV